MLNTISVQQLKDLNIVLSKNFNDYLDLNYEKIIADTYMFNDGTSFIQFEKLLDNRFFSIKNKFINHPLLEKYTFEEILIIGTL